MSIEIILFALAWFCCHLHIGPQKSSFAKNMPRTLKVLRKSDLDAVGGGKITEPHSAVLFHLWRGILVRDQRPE